MNTEVLCWRLMVVDEATQTFFFCFYYDLQQRSPVPGNFRKLRLLYYLKNSVENVNNTYVNTEPVYSRRKNLYSRTLNTRKFTIRVHVFYTCSRISVSAILFRSANINSDASLYVLHVSSEMTIIYYYYQGRSSKRNL